MNMAHVLAKAFQQTGASDTVVDNVRDAVEQEMGNLATKQDITDCKSAIINEVINKMTSRALAIGALYTTVLGVLIGVVAWFLK